MAIEKEYVLKLSTVDAQANVDELNKSLVLQEDLIDGLEKEIRQYEKQLDKTSKVDLAAQKKIKDALKEKKQALKDEKIALKDLNKDRKKANEELKDATENAADYSGALGLVDKQTGGLVSGLQNLKGGLGGATKGMNLLKVAIIGTGIGALLIAITAVTAAFKGSEEGQNKYAKILGVIGAVTGNIVDLFADLGELIIGLFSGDSEAVKSIKSFGKKLFDLVGLPIKNTIDTVKALGKALGALFSGDISGAFDELKQGVVDIKENFDEAKDVIVGATEAVKDFVDEQIKEGEAAAKVADMRAKADKIERKLIVERSKLESDIALLRLKARQEDKFGAKERKDALIEAQNLENTLLDKQTQYLELRRDAKILENTFSRTNKENLTEEAEAVAAVNRQVAQRANVQRQLQRELNTINNELEAEKKAKEAEEKERKEQEQEEARLKQEAIDSSEKERLDKILKEKNERIEEEKRIEAEMVRFKKELQTQNLNNISAGFSLLGQLAGKNKGLQAAAIIGESAVNVARSVIETQASNVAITAQGAALAIPTGGASVGIAAKLVTANTIGAGIGIAANIAATAKALSALGKGGAPQSQQIRTQPSIPSDTETESLAPAFNTVGASGTNQLADAIGGQSQQPVQAFVVSSDVTSAQELDRNRIEDASIG